MHGGVPVVQAPEPHYRWPRITPAVEQAVLRQLHESVSVKGRSGVIQALEERFCRYYSARYCLLHSSGTMALFAMFDALGLRAGDEVICQNYTWFATVSPLTYLGVRPTFCDVDENGNLDATQLEDCRTERTRAVIVTHMWGMPCDMDPIVRFCERHGLLLMEDCSHAHGAEYKGRKVGTFGTASAWSLQGSKTVAAGEGGVLMTNSEDVYARALLTGHYNRRCKDDVPIDHPLREFWQTGLGLKLRIHPLGAAIADEQMSHLDEWMERRRIYADYMCEAFSRYDFLQVPQETNCRSAWYFFPLRFDASRTRVSRERFHAALLAEGVKESDIPGLTGPVAHLPLFRRPEAIRPELFSSGSRTEHIQVATPVAERIASELILLPVWSGAEDEALVHSYIRGVCKVAEAVRTGALQEEGH